MSNGYLDISRIEGDEHRVGEHLYRRDTKYDGRFRCVFCGTGWIAIPLRNVECEWNHAEELIHLFEREGGKAPFMSVRRFAKEVRNLDALLRLRIEMGSKF